MHACNHRGALIPAEMLQVPGQETKKARTLGLSPSSVREEPPFSCIGIFFGCRFKNKATS